MQYFCCNAPKSYYIYFIAPAGNWPGAFDQVRADIQRAAARFQMETVLTKRIIPMAEIQSAPAKSKPKPVAALGVDSKFEMPKFEMPKFEMPKFEMPNMEVPPAFREAAEKGIAQAKDNYEKIKSAAEQATGVLEETYATASKGCSGYGLKVIETARANSNCSASCWARSRIRKSSRRPLPL
jgi:hypothetical protein